MGAYRVPDRRMTQAFVHPRPGIQIEDTEPFHPLMLRESSRQTLTQAVGNRSADSSLSVEDGSREYQPLPGEARPFNREAGRRLVAATALATATGSGFP